MRTGEARKNAVSDIPDGHQPIDIHGKSTAIVSTHSAMFRRTINPVKETVLPFLCIRVYFAL
jgi:hypothetical protein